MGFGLGGTSMGTVRGGYVAAGVVRLIRRRPHPLDRAGTAPNGARSPGCRTGRVATPSLVPLALPSMSRESALLAYSFWRDARNERAARDTR